MSLTPMMQQYWEIKERYPDAILLFRLGDFYEMFFEDALLASRELELTLTGRGAGLEERAPMCGVPYHAVDGYIARLVSAGHKVAICEQVEDPAKAKGLVRRDVTRVITPGTVTDESLLEPKGNRYLVSLAMEAGDFGLAVVDFSTGEFQVAEFHGPEAGQQVRDELAALAPVEALLNQAAFTNPRVIKTLDDCGTRTEVRAVHEFSYHDAERRLCRQLSVSSLGALGCDGLPLAVGAAGAALSYLEGVQPAGYKHLCSLRLYQTGEEMVLDVSTRRNLEITSSLKDRGGFSLFGVIDRTFTAMGGRLLRRWLEHPLLNEKVINHRLDAVEELFNNGEVNHALKELLRGFYDLERLAARLALGTANPRDLLALANSLGRVPGLKKVLEGAESTLLRETGDGLDSLEEICDLIIRAIKDDPPVALRDGGIIRDGYNSDLDCLRHDIKNGKDWIASMEQRERKNTGIRSLKVGFNKVFGYYLEVSRTNLGLVPESYQRKQTLANGERYITTELKEWETRVLGAEERLVQLEYELFMAVREQVSGVIPKIQGTARQVARIDSLLSLARVALERNYRRPKVHGGRVLRLVEARHPVVEAAMAGERFVPNDLYLNGEKNLALITGPNMAGKSTYIRSVALVVLMAQIGSFVPAREAEIGVMDRVFARIGAADDLASGQSTFMVEMNETANILRNATGRSLIILDEVGRGTSTYDGLSIAWALVEFLAEQVGARTLFATHYHELIALEDLLPGVTNLSVAVKEESGDIVFLHSIVPGGSDRSYGLHVARLAGLPRDLLDRAEEVLDGLEEIRTPCGFEVAASLAPSEEIMLPSAISGEDIAKKSFNDEMVDLLQGINILELTPLKAMGLLQDLHLQAMSRKGGEKG